MTLKIQDSKFNICNNYECLYKIDLKFTLEGAFSSSELQNLLTNLFKCSKCLFISVASTISIIIDLNERYSSL